MLDACVRGFLFVLVIELLWFASYWCFLGVWCCYVYLPLRLCWFCGGFSGCGISCLILLMAGLFAVLGVGFAN